MSDKMPYFNGRVLFNGIAISYLFMISKTSVWISGLLGTILGVLILLLFKNSGNKISKIVSGFIISLVALIILVNMGHSLYLKNTPIWILTIILAIATLVISNTKRLALKKVCNILFIYSIFLFLLELFGLSGSIKLQNLLPLFNTDVKNIIWGSIVFALTSVTPIFVLNDTTDKKNLIIYYLVSSLSVQVICFLAISILGSKEVLLLRYPETIVLKRIEFLNFISSVDTIFNFAIIADVMLTMCACLKNIESATSKTWKYISIILITLLTIYGTHEYWPLLIIYNYFPFVLIFLLILAIIPIKRKYKNAD